ncbi:MAG: hypothetical protein A3B37_01630 [Candidatus Sungbacteria bacterium RIFCSPLOWO2_01_FULL_59_16]|uniref:Type II secretion system protein GspG C-terminal domain-containing protein n=1 Tax=Candidatus Sungbacteria bacterium RIFCSPLOWO2_01_FULL_59_16 TaxID=1802280 RepID=A0A1G2L9T3_9BACT|nr:MAG: hypothetical protein A3B37_01630 [Candidatus Sungbacteria bacterium RIFCSPLOWO2_01_FULL_59_16]
MSHYLNNLRRGGRKGFTLIELLVVIAIIGILASIVLASLNTARQKSRDARRISDVKQIQLALELFADSNSQEYPDAVADLETDDFLPATPLDPVSGAGYPYDNFEDSTGGACAIDVGSCLYYHLGANLEDDGTGAVGTGGNSVLGSDSDSALGFAGLSTDCVTAGSDDGCFDVTP